VTSGATMACCTSLPYFMSSDRDHHAISLDCDDLLLYDTDTDEDNVMMKCLALLSESDVDKAALPVSLCAKDSSPLLNDCMWSAGMLPPDLKAASTPAAATLTSVDDVDVMCTAVDPSLISPCPHVNQQPVTPTSTDTGRHLLIFLFN